MKIISLKESFPAGYTPREILDMDNEFSTPSLWDAETDAEKNEYAKQQALSDLARQLNELKLMGLNMDMKISKKCSVISNYWDQQIKKYTLSE